MPRIFLSHISEEKDLALLLKERLEVDFLGLIGIFVSSDETSIPAGDKWLDALKTALEQAEVVIVLCSHTAIKRPWINLEVGAAWLKGITIVPLCHGGLTKAELPSPLNVSQAIDATSQSDLRRLYGLIASKLNSSVPPVDFASLASEIDVLDERYRSSPSLPQQIESDLLDEVLQYAADLSSRQREMFAAIESADGRRTVVELFPEFERDNSVHRDLQALRDRKLVRPFEAGSWQSQKHPIVTRFARLLQTIKRDAIVVRKKF